MSTQANEDINLYLELKDEEETIITTTHNVLPLLVHPTAF